MKTYRVTNEFLLRRSLADGEAGPVNTPPEVSLNAQAVSLGSKASSKGDINRFNSVLERPVNSAIPGGTTTAFAQRAASNRAKNLLIVRRARNRSHHAFDPLLIHFEERKDGKSE